MAVDDLITLNAARLGSRRAVSPGERLVLPASRLSARDREILAGITPGSRQRFRPYPVRAGETAAAIAANRKIGVAELAAANPGVDMERLAANQVIRLPPGAYSVREREMLTGTLAVPFEFFSSAATPGVVGGACVAVAGAVAAVLFKKWRAGDT
jgi:LysM repeat protein